MIDLWPDIVPGDVVTDDGNTAPVFRDHSMGQLERPFGVVGRGSLALVVAKDGRFHEGDELVVVLISEGVGLTRLRWLKGARRP